MASQFHSQLGIMRGIGSRNWRHSKTWLRIPIRLPNLHSLFWRNEHLLQTDRQTDRRRSRRNRPNAAITSERVSRAVGFSAQLI